MVKIKDSDLLECYNFIKIYMRQQYFFDLWLAAIEKR